MPTTLCNSCGCHTLEWRWEEAFDKFGFNDGDGQIETDQVITILMNAGYEVQSSYWGLHNRTITSIIKNGQEFMPNQISDITVGYDCPRSYLPQEIIQLLDRELPAY